MRIRAYLLMVCLAALPVGAARSQVISNGSFESPGFADPPPAFHTLLSGSGGLTDWTVSGFGVDYFKASGAGPGPAFTAADGQYLIDLVRGPGQQGVISQSVSGLSPGTTYQLSFSTRQEQLGAGTTINASFGTASGSFNNATASLWEAHALLFTATGSSAPVVFSGPASGGQDVGVFVDNAQVTAVPEPGILAPAGAAAAAGWACSRRRGRQQ